MSITTCRSTLLSPVSARANSAIPDVKATFHYTGPTGPARTLSENRTDPTEFLGDPGRKKKSVRVRARPVGPVYWNLAKTAQSQM